MYTLASAELQVEVLDPVADQARFGVRYCTGGYIFQVSDAAHGPLMTGPTYPDSFNWFDGQGIPDSFNFQPLRDPAAGGPLALVLGIGVCDLAQRTIAELCAWQVELAPAEVRMRTSHAFQGFALELERTVRVAGRTVRSATRVSNTGRAMLPISWFPHPFYPQPATPELIRLSIPVRMPENAGYVLSESGWIARRGEPDQRGFFQALDHDAQANLSLVQRHPALGLVAATCSYTPALFPIWGNRNTFSWEPYFERTLAPGQSADWWVDYDF